MNIQETTDNWQIEFGQSQSPQQLAMLGYLNRLSPEERTELLGELYSLVEANRNELMLTEGENREWIIQKR